MRRTRWIAIASGLAAASCRVPPAVEPLPTAGAPTTTPEAVTDEAVADDLGVIAVALVPITAGGDAIAIEDVGPAIDACKAAGWPATLPLERAKAVPEQGIGARMQVVHPGGVAVVTVESIDCTPAGDIEGAIASLMVRDAAPAGEPEPGSGIGEFGGRPHLAVVGATVAATARLAGPPVIDIAATPTVRASLVRYATALASERRKTCTTEGSTDQLPSEDTTRKAIDPAVLAARAHTIRAAGASLTFAVLQDAAVVFGCHGQEELAGVLLDAAGNVLYEIDSNNSIELQWVMDLDGDGTQEALVDVHWMEDGMHEVDLLSHRSNGWDHTVLWSADTP